MKQAVVEKSSAPIKVTDAPKDRKVKGSYPLICYQNVINRPKHPMMSQCHDQGSYFRFSRMCFAGVVNNNELQIGVSRGRIKTFRKSLMREIAIGRAVKRPIAIIPLDKDSTARELFLIHCDQIGKEEGLLKTFFKSYHLKGEEKENTPFKRLI